MTFTIRRSILVVVLSLLVVAAGIVLVSQRAGAASSTPVVYVATGENFPDALGAGPAAAMVKGPILLVQSDAIPSATAAELVRLSPGKIVIVGGTAVVSASVEAALGAYASTVERVAGANRYETAAQLSAAIYPAKFDADTLGGKTSSDFVQDGQPGSVSHGMIVDGAVNAAKTWDEPGIAVNVPAQQILLTTPSWQVLATTSITPPAQGYVIADMSGSVCINHTNGTQDALVFGFVNPGGSATWTVPAPNTIEIPASDPTGRPCQPINQRVVYQVSGGAALEARLLGQQFSGASPTSTMFVNTIVTLTYFPTAYGTVDLTH
jgi:hypothetical protein